MSPEQTDSLISYIDNELNEEEVTALEEQLKQDAELRGAFSMLLRQHIMLANIESKKAKSRIADNQPVTAKTVRRQKNTEPVTAKTVRRTKPNQGSATRSTRRKKKKNSIPFTLIGSIAAALLVAIAWMLLSPPVETSGTVIEQPKLLPDLPIISQASGDITWAKPRVIGDQIQHGEQINLGDNGYLKLKFEDGSITSFNAHSDISVFKHKLLELKTGKVNANIRKQATGHTVTIRTEIGEIRVVGTSFTVEVAGDKTIASVQEGTVEFDDHLNGEVYTLTKDEEYQVDHKVKGEIARTLVANVIELGEGNEHVELVVKTTTGKQIAFKPVWRDGGFDKKMSRRLGQLKVGDQLRIHWYFEEHFRIADYEKLNQ